MKLIKKRYETKWLCSVCGKELKSGHIYRYNNNEKCCESCYFSANPPHEEETITERLHQQRAVSGYHFQSDEVFPQRVKKPIQPVPLEDPIIRAEWEACPPPPFPNLTKPRTKHHLVEQSRAFYSGRHTQEEKEKFELYRENMLKILDRQLWNYQQELRAKQRAEAEKAKKEAEELHQKQMAELEEEHKQKAIDNRKIWMVHLEPFVRKHAKTEDCAEQIYAYIRDVVQLADYPSFGKSTIITENSIECSSVWTAFSFFDDGGSEQEECKFQLWYAGDPEKDKISNDRICNQEPYDKRGYTHSIHDSFFCENPLGLSGIFGFRFDYEHETEEPYISQ